MAQTLWTETLIIVVRASLKDIANSVAQIADPDNVGDTFHAGTALRAVGDATNTVTHYYCRWVMKPDQKDRIVAEFGKQSGTPTIYAEGATLSTNRQYWLCNGTEGQWTAVQVLAALGLDTLAPRGT